MMGLILRWGSLQLCQSLVNGLHFDVLLDNAFKIEQKVKYKSDLEITG